MDFQELFRSLVNQAGAKTVFADPVTTADRTVVPVAKVRCGFGGGSGKKASDSSEGGGGGGGFVAHPLGYIEITYAGTRFVAINDPLNVAIAAATGVCIGLFAGRLIR
jgi:uncharacterized spore protein YtfJ